MIAIGDVAVITYLMMYLPWIIEKMGYHDANIHLMTVPPYIIAYICCLLVAYSSSRCDEHAYHIVSCLLIALLGFILMATLIHYSQAKYVGICIGFIGSMSAYPLLLSWLTNNIVGHHKRLISIGFVMGIRQIGRIILPLVRFLLLRTYKNSFFFLGI